MPYRLSGREADAQGALASRPRAIAGLPRMLFIVACSLVNARPARPPKYSAKVVVGRDDRLQE